MFSVYIDDNECCLKPSDFLAEGGEAEIYRINADEVLKLFKQPNHPQFSADRQAAQAAKVRLQEHQTKLEMFPKLPAPHVVRPNSLVYNNRQASREVIGYTMSYISSASCMHEFAQRDFQEKRGLSAKDILDVFTDLHSSVSALHNHGVVIGDFNHLNVLISDRNAYIVDADSMQYSNYSCKSFTLRYTDPTILKLEDGQIILSGPYSAETDWYAFATMLFEALIHVHPYGGVYKPKPPLQKISPDERALKRISVFNQDVLFPKAGKRPHQTLSDELHSFFIEMLQNDVRKPFPLDLLRGKVSIRKSTPAGNGSISRLHGKSHLVFSTEGVILSVVHDGSSLRYLYHLDNRYRREDGQIVLNGDPDPELRFAIQKSSTLIGKGKRLFIFTGDDVHRRIAVDQFRCREPIFDCNDTACYFIEEGQLFSLVNGRKKLIDEVLKEQSRIWVGPRFGFGFYVAGEFKRAFLFTSDTAGRKLLDIEGLSGNLLKVACRFTERHLWLIATLEKCGQIFNRVTLFDDNGCFLGSCEKIDGSGDWMDGIHRSCAASLPDQRGGEIESLMVPSSNGVMRIEADGNLLRVAQVFPETESLLEAGDNLLYTSTGLYAWNSKSIRLLNIG